MTSADYLSAGLESERISIRRAARSPVTTTATAAFDAIQLFLQRRALEREGRTVRAEAVQSALEGSLTALDDIRAKAGIPKQLAGAIVVAALVGGLLVALGRLNLYAGPPCPVHPVVGRITTGTWVPVGAQIVFHPVSRQLPDQAVPRATVRDDGAFWLSTFGSEDGAPEGDYVVTIQWFRIGEDGSPGPNILPARYARPDSSPLRVVVNVGRNELPPFVIAR